MTFRLVSLPTLSLFYSLASDVFVRRFLMEGTEISLSECRQFVLDSDTLFAQLGVGLYLVYEANTLIGYAGFVATRPGSADLEILFALPASQSGRGHASRICADLIDVARRASLSGDLVAVVHPENLASLRVLEKNGFVCGGQAAGDLAHLLAYRFKL